MSACDHQRSWNLSFWSFFGAAAFAWIIACAPADGGSVSDPSASGDPSDSGDSSDSGDPGGEACAGEPLRSGEATFYGADGSGNCSFPAGTGLPMVAALNDPDYMNAAWCGACAEVTGPSGAVTVTLVDRCPECASGDLDLSAEAFAAIADPDLGRVPITWRIVPCAASDALRFHFKDGSSQWWTAIQVRDHRHAIASLEYSVDGNTFTPVAREIYNYFVATEGMGPDPLTLRVRDVYGGEVITQGVAVGDNLEVGGGGQFPPCAE